MNECVIQYDDGMDLRQLIAHHHRGDQVLCDRCGRPLTFVLSLHRVTELHMNLGIYCLNYPEHVSITINAR